VSWDDNLPPPFKDLEYIKKKMREIRGPEPWGFIIYPDGTWKLWFGENDEEK